MSAPTMSEWPISSIDTSTVEQLRLPPATLPPNTRPQHHGRRLFQMLLRSNHASAPEHDNSDGRIEQSQDVESSIKSDLEQSESESSADPGSSASMSSSSKFLALKRKLFPTKKRRHPARIPPLVVVSPITSSGNHVAFKSDDQSEERSDQPRPLSNNQEQPQYSSARRSVVDTDRQRLVMMAVELAQQMGSSNDAPSNSDDQDDFDDDLELEYAIAAMDTETSTSEETLAEMSRAIEELQQWRGNQQRVTENAMKRIEENSEDSDAMPPAEDDSNTIQELYMATKQQREQKREQLNLELKQEAATYEAQSAILCTTAVPEQDAVRMIQVLTESTDPADDGMKVSQLQDDVFALGVKDLQMDRQTQWQQNLETECSLERTLADMQAFATDLDSLLAQFVDAP